MGSAAAKEEFFLARKTSGSSSLAVDVVLGRILPPLVRTTEGRLERNPMVIRG
jgi:hypothetical protein